MTQSHHEHSSPSTGSIKASNSLWTRMKEDFTQVKNNPAEWVQSLSFHNRRTEVLGILGAAAVLQLILSYQAEQRLSHSYLSMAIDKTHFAANALNGMLTLLLLWGFTTLAAIFIKGTPRRTKLQLPLTTLTLFSYALLPSILGDALSVLTSPLTMGLIGTLTMTLRDSTLLILAYGVLCLRSKSPSLFQCLGGSVFFLWSWRLCQLLI